mgnify:CR=1 FL=1
MPLSLVLRCLIIVGGVLVRYHAGGADTEAPNHLSDLTLWNLEVTGTIDEKGINFASDFKWWDAGNVWWKIYPPIVVGTHGQAVTFSQEEGQLTYEESTGGKGLLQSHCMRRSFRIAWDMYRLG